MSASTPHEGRPLHVMIVVKGLGLGGAERLIVEQVLRSRDRGIHYSVAYARADKAHFVADLRSAGVDVVPLASPRRPWPLVLAAEMRRRRPDIVHSHSPLPAAVARVLVRLPPTRSRHVYTEHNRWQAYRWPTRVVNALTMPLDHQGWAVSVEARGSVRPSRRQRRVQVLHHGIDVEHTRRLAAEQAAAIAVEPPEGSTVLVHVANLRPEKAHDHLLSSFAVAAAERDDLFLWLVGQGLDDARFRELLGRCPARGRVSVLGYRDDAVGLIRRADALVLSSDHEGLPVAVMEALAVGTPVVATAVGGIPEAVTDGCEGLLVPPRDVQALATAMRRVADDRAATARLAQGASRRASDFDVHAATSVQLDVYRRLAGA